MKKKQKNQNRFVQALPPALPSSATSEAKLDASLKCYNNYCDFNSVRPSATLLARLITEHVQFDLLCNKSSIRFGLR